MNYAIPIPRRPALFAFLGSLGLLLLALFFHVFPKSTLSADSSGAAPKLLKDQAALAWAEQVYAQMSEDERIGQLFMIRAHSDKGPDHVAAVEQLLRSYHVGGLCFFQGNPEEQARLCNQYQALSGKVPLMVSMDAEWGLGMRLKSSTISFPRQLTLGALQDNALIYDMGREVARQMRRLGVHVNFAPVVDVNNNPNNPVINDRSFGEDRYNVTAKSFMYMKGLQDGRVMACAKHFPGHGDTDVDSHHDLPLISHQRARLDSIEMFPFRVLAQHDIQSMMVAHLAVPALDNTANLPTTLSAPTVTEILKKNIGFEGLIFTDGLEMQGVAKHHRSGELEVKALQAGNDVLLLPGNVPAAHKAIKAALASGELPAERLEESVKKVLYYKHLLGLTEAQRIELEGLRADLNSTDALILKQKLYDKAMTLVRQEGRLLPFTDLGQYDFASLSIGRSGRTPFQDHLDKYVSMAHFSEAAVSANSTGLINSLAQRKVVIVGIHGMSSRAKERFGISAGTVGFLEALQAKTQVIVVLFGNPYALQYLDGLDNVVLAYQEEDMSQLAAAEAIFGAIPFEGKLPVSASPRSRFDQGLQIGDLGRLEYGLPESVGLDGAVLSRIDTIAEEAIRIGATPGCQVLVAKNGKVVYDKAFGHHTYAKHRPVQSSDLYDLASVTKIAATTVSLMKLHEQGRLDLNQSLGHYVPLLRGSNKSGLLVKDVLAHHAGLQAWIPFYKETLSKHGRRMKPSEQIYRHHPDDGFSVPVAQDLYIQDAYVDQIYNSISQSDLRGNRNYKYSDLGFILFRRLIEELAGQPMDAFAAEHFYKPLGMNNTTYNPWQRVDLARIVPSEQDEYFRNQEIKGYVHDMGAAMLGGVSGHAGLFANANDLAKLMQMLLQNGYYGGQQVLSAETVRLFTSRYPYCSRRGYGFDMKETDLNKSCNISTLASDKTFGHLGFTGISCWADPEAQITFIFLSNRTYPSMDNWKLNSADIRPRIQSVIYEALREQPRF